MTRMRVERKLIDMHGNKKIWFKCFISPINIGSIQIAIQQCSLEPIYYIY
jgi:hypothetical protein